MAHEDKQAIEATMQKNPRAHRAAELRR